MARSNSKSSSNTPTSHAEMNSSNDNNDNNQNNSAEDNNSDDNSLQLQALFMAAFFVPMCVYVRTLGPTVLGGDSGDIVVSAHTLATPHPPGYPLITMLGHLAIQMVAIGEPAYRVALLNTVFASMASFFVAKSIFLVLVQLHECNNKTSANVETNTKRIVCAWISLVSALFFSFSRHIWIYAVTPEVFALNNMFVSMIIYFSLRYGMYLDSRNRILTARMGIFISVLALTNQHTAVIIEVPISLYILCTAWKWTTFKTEFLLWIVLAVLAASPYLFLPWSARALSGTSSELLSWGNQATMRGFLRHFLREEYGTWDLISNMEGNGFAANVHFYLSHLSEETQYFGLMFVPLGIVSSLFFSDNRGLLAVVSAYLFYLVFFLARNNLDLNVAVYRGVVRRFFLQAHVFSSVLLGVGLSRPIFLIAKIVPFSLLVSSTTLLPILLCMFPLYQCGVNYPFANASNATAVGDYGRGQLSTLPMNSILLTKGDLTIYPTRYIQECLGERRDLIVMDQEIMGYEWYIHRARLYYADRVTFPKGNHLRGHGTPGIVFNLKQFFDANFDHSPIFIVDAKSGDSSYINDYDFEPYGFAHKVIRKNSIKQQIQPKLWTQNALQLINKAAPQLLPEEYYGDETWEGLVRQEYWATKHRTYLWCLNRADRATGNPKLQQEWITEAVLGLHQLIKESPVWQVAKNGAIAAERLWKQHQVSWAKDICFEMFDIYLSLGNNTAISNDSTKQHFDPEFARAADYIAQLKKNISK